MKLDRRKTYYRIDSEQFHDGLVVDFRPLDAVVHGLKCGIYFTTAENLYKFFGYGHQSIRPIKIPKNAKVIREYQNCTEYEYRADRVMMLPSKDIDWYF